MRKDETREKDEQEWTSMVFVTPFRELVLGFPPEESERWEKIKDTDEITIEIKSCKILQKKHPIKQKRDFDLVLFELLPDATQGRHSGEDFLNESEYLKTLYEKIRSSAKKEMQKQFKLAKRQPEKVLYGFMLENPWNLREEWVIKTIVDWRGQNFFATTDAERNASRKKLEGIGKCLVVRTGEPPRGIRNVKPCVKFPRSQVDPRYSQASFLLHDLNYLMAELTKLKSETEKRKFLKVALESNKRMEEFCSSFWSELANRQKIEEHTEDIISTAKESKRGQMRELALEIVSDIFKMSVGALKKNLFEQDRAVEFEVNIFINNQFYQRWKI